MRVAAFTPTTHEARRSASTRRTGRRPSDPSIRSCQPPAGNRVPHSGCARSPQFSAALWNLDIDSELLFVGDGGITEPSRATRRYGVELGAYWTPLEAVIVDADYSWSHARFTESDPAGDYIPVR